MSPEALGFDAQNEKTDVWGFGVLLWECATMGKIPYSHISDDEEVVRGVMAGSLRLYQPSGMPTSLFNLMDCCLNHSAEDRPRFAQIKVALVRIAEEMGALGLCTRL
jgi:CUB/sushi domain-containing protein